MSLPPAVAAEELLGFLAALPAVEPPA